MNFRLSDYSLEINENFPFITIHKLEDSACELKLLQNNIMYANKYRVEYFDCKTKNVKSLSKLQTDITAIETNGEILLCGDVTGAIKLCDFNKNTLNSYHEHTSKINQLKIFNGTNFLSCSDDLSVKAFKFNEKNSFTTHNMHKDYVKDVEFFNNSIYSCSMDKRMISYDVNSESVVFDIAFSDPLSHLAILNDNEIIVTMKNNILKFDVRNRNIIKRNFAHTHDISKIKVYEGKIYTASTDGILKMFSSDLKPISRVNFGNSILSFDIWGSEIAVSLDNGDIMSLISDPIVAEETNMKTYKKFKSRYFEDVDHIEVKRLKQTNEKLTAVEILMNNNQHYLAFSKMLDEGNLDTIFSVLSFISNKRGLKNMLIDRNLSDILFITDLIIDNFFVNGLQSIFIEILTILTSVYEEYYLFKDPLKEKLEHLLQVILEEYHLQVEANKFTGFAELYMLDN
ncbi:hypothetical protein EDEG_01358 [Edhazardia aedis USNM 41457]|uniref:U3 small nucleolar RNA-associated protein 15 C-terminal domain-containing protein n=1 Tax=Edhazardia aedis (strain USNM 41457) TaxID=1003232 RepID=J9DA64_EDHAE|nr:hypothetical protein EDEG_01358 [Edhazardia aedis USNM 41457]|eukprot:EJW04404.1 hypothetical protein EDEG_01358 [Edhazardia aedis USNM 41457]